MALEGVGMTWVSVGHLDAEAASPRGGASTRPAARFYHGGLLTGAGTRAHLPTGHPLLSVLGPPETLQREGRG